MRTPEENLVVLRIANLGRSERPRPRDPDVAPRAPKRLEVFSIGTDRLQVTWSSLGPGRMRFAAGETVRTVVADGGPGAITLDGLPPGRVVDVTVSGPGIDGACRLPATTLPVPPGEELYRFATISDVHIGTATTGFFHTITELPRPDELYPQRCLRGALREAGAWGAQRIVVKGDLVDRSTEVNWAIAATELQRSRLPIQLAPGNHELCKPDGIDPHGAARRHGLDFPENDAVAVDVPGLRIVLADSTVPGSDHGRLAHVTDAVAQLARDAERPVLVGVHHQPMRHRVPTYIPPGVPGPEARRFVRALRRANRRSMVSSGHTHRHRRHTIDGVTWSEVGATKDFPGTWAGYQVFEGGIVQTVHRIAEPTAILWTDHVRRAAAGVWSLWAPGLLPSRCFSLDW